MCTWSCRISFFALVTATSGLPCSSSTMNFTCAPDRLFFISSRYIWKPSTMSLPTAAKMPVVGARKPMRSSSAPAVAPVASARPPPRSIGPTVRSNACVIVLSPLLPRLCSCGSAQSRRRGRQFLAAVPVAERAAATADALGKAHQPARQVEDRQHVDGAEHVLPPRHQRAEIFAQRDDDEGADHAANQRAGAAEHRHQQRVDRGGELYVHGTDNAGGMRPQHAREPAKRAGDDEGNVFVQPGIVAEDLHAQ